MVREAIRTSRGVRPSSRTALWKDVQQKAYRLMQNNDVEIQSISTFSILCEVAGDTEIYDTYVNQRV